MARIPDNLLRDPLEYLRADHDRQLLLCDLLERLAVAENPTAEVDRTAAVHDYLSRDLPIHVAAETTSLFPRLLQFCQPADGVVAMTERLQTDHSTEELLARGLVDCLSSLRDNSRAADRLRQIGVTFIKSQRGHLNWENAVTLPLAAVRIPAEELDPIGREIAALRGIDFPD